MKTFFVIWPIFWGSMTIITVFIDFHKIINHYKKKKEDEL